MATLAGGGSAGHREDPDRVLLEDSSRGCCSPSEDSDRRLPSTMRPGSAGAAGLCQAVAALPYDCNTNPV
jgi:hypothetical protein